MPSDESLVTLGAASGKVSEPAGACNTAQALTTRAQEALMATQSSAFAMHQVKVLFYLLATEEWRPIAEYPRLLISTRGRVWSTIANRLRGLNCGRRGRPAITFNIDGRPCWRNMARLVLNTFRPCSESGMLARHLNDVCSDNRIENLEWGTPQQNMDDRRRNHGGILNTGRHNGRSKLRERDVVVVRNMIASGEATRSEMARRYNVSWTTIDEAVKGITWTHVAEGAGSEK